jgi:acyl carrier protein/SAM-dependent methyltransferase
MTAKRVPSPPPPVIQMISQLPSVEKQLRQMLSEITDVPADQFQMTVTLDQLGIDSLMTTEIVSEVQEAFNIPIDPAQILDLQTFGALCSYLDAHESRQGSVDVVDQSPQAKLAPPLPSTLALSSVEEQDDIREVVIERTASVAESSGVPDHEELVAQLASLLGIHLECPPTDFTRSTNLMDRGLDSLLSMELMSDIEEIFGVSIDSSLLLSESSFGHLADILVSAVTSLRLASSTVSSTVASTRAQSTGMTTPGTITDNSVDGGDIFTATTKVKSVSATTVLNSAPQAFESIKGNFEKFAEKYGFSEFYTKVADKQADLVLAYVVEAYADFGIDLNTLGPREQIPRMPVAPKHDRMIKVFNEILRRGKLADYDGKGYVRSDAIVQIMPSSVLYKDILAQFPQHAKEHTLLNLCGSDMSKLLAGTMDPLALLFGNKANREILEDVYSTAPMFVIHSELLTDYLEKALSTSSPGADGKFHIMELGAGTGATTRWIVDRLVQCGIPIEYTFTDISSALVTSGKRKFARYDCMKYGTVDIEKDPPAQYLGQFDIVLATNCIHATRNLLNSMGNISKLLRPHGFVSLVELTTRNYWLDMVFGLLDGWWLYDDGRPYVLATPEFWENTMLQVGFQHVSWTGGHTPESEVVRVIAGFKQPVQDPSSFRSVPQEKTGNIETVVFAHTDKDLPLRADIHYPSPQRVARHETWVTGTV